MSVREQSDTTERLWEGGGHPGTNGAAFYEFIKLVTPPVTPCSGSALTDEWRDHVNEEDAARDQTQGGVEGVMKLNLIGCDVGAWKLKYYLIILICPQPSESVVLAKVTSTI